MNGFRMCLLQIRFYVLGISAVFTMLQVHMTLHRRGIINFAFITCLQLGKLKGVLGCVLQTARLGWFQMC